ncbi:MAG: MlaD family protein, partial [Terriglobales bacterium]
MPSQKQVSWAQLRVGITVLVASVILAVTIFLVTGTTGLFTKSIRLKAYFDNAEGLRLGAPVRLQGVDIGNVTGVRIVPDRPASPVEVTLKVSTKYHFSLRKDSVATLNTAGALGEVYVDINSAGAKAEAAADDDTILTEDRPGLQDVVRSSQSTLQNMEILLKRLDRIVAAVERGEGSVGKLIYDPTLFNRLNQTMIDVQEVVRAVSRGEGTVGKLIKDDALYRKANASVDKLNRLIDEVEQGKGTVGKLMKDPSLYQQAEQTVSKANILMSDVTAGKGLLGKVTKDEEFARKVDNTMTRL